MSSSRSGFALITVLWIMVAASVLALAGIIAARDSVSAATNRVDAMRAHWLASGCIDEVLATVDQELRTAQQTGAVLRTWRTMEPVRRAMSEQTGCDVRLESAGSRLDVNAADSLQLLALFRAIDIDDAETLVDRLLDWRDADDDQRPNGAERDWYRSNGRVEPRNSALVHASELRRIAGFESLADLDKVFDVEPGRIDINSAPLHVLATVPGFTPELLSRVDVERQSNRPIADVMPLAAGLSSTASDEMMRYYARITERTTVTPDAWVVTARAASGSPPLVVHSDARFSLGNGRVVVTRRRSWL